MAQWFNIFKKKKRVDEVVIFDRTTLQTHMDNLSYQIYPLKNDMGFKVVWEVIKIAKNMAALEIALSKDEKELASFRGRYKAIADLDAYFEVVTTKEFHEKEKEGEIRGKIDLVKKEKRRQATSNLAGIV